MENATNHFFIPTKESMAHYFPRHFFGISEEKIALFCMEHKLNLLTFGHAGVGKTSFLRWLASQLQVPYVLVPSNESMSAPELQGETRQNKETTIWEWQDSELVKVFRNGGIIDLGEIDKLAKNSKNFILSMLDESRTIILSAHNGEVVTASPNLLISANYNPNYIGSQRLPEQFADRFAVKLQYHYDRAIESKYIRSSALLDMAYGIRETSNYDNESVTTSKSVVFETPTTGRMLKAFELIATKLSFDLACDIFANNYQPDERPAVKMLLEGSAFNIKDELGIQDEFITTEHANA